MKHIRGFTLVELVMVIVIMGSLSAYAASKFDIGTFEAAAVTTELVSAIRYAQEKSMSNTEPGMGNYQVAINGGGYVVTQAGNPISNPVTGVAPYQSTWSNVTLTPTGVVAFDGYGAPTLTAPLVFGGNQEIITVTVGADSETVTVEQVTGFTR